MIVIFHLYFNAGVGTDNQPLERATESVGAIKCNNNGLLLLQKPAGPVLLIINTNIPTAKSQTIKLLVDAHTRKNGLMRMTKTSRAKLFKASLA